MAIEGGSRCPEVESILLRYPDQDMQSRGGKLGQCTGRPDPGYAAGLDILAHLLALALPGKAKPRRIRDRRVAQFLSVRMPGKNGSFAVHERGHGILSWQRLRTRLHVFFQVQRCEQYELRLDGESPGGFQQRGVESSAQ